jgi:hypothetical protein
MDAHHGTMALTGRARSRRARWGALVAVTALLGGLLVTLGTATVATPAAAEEVRPHPDCIPGPNPNTWVVPEGYPEGTQCLLPNENGAAISPRRAAIAWGDTVTWTYTADNVGDPEDPDWNVLWPSMNAGMTVEGGCGVRDLTCTVRYTPGGSWHGLDGTLWQNFGAYSGGRRSGYGAVWVTPTMYKVHVKANRPDGTALTDRRTSGGVAVRPGDDPTLDDCLFLGGWEYYRPGTTPGLDAPWGPPDGGPRCVDARWINAQNPTVYPDWAFGLPPGEWDLYLWDEHSPVDPHGPARQPTPYDMVHVSVGDADQQVFTVLHERPRPQVSVEVLGQQPVALDRERTVRVTVDAGASDAGYAEVDLDPADLGLTVGDPSVAEIVSGPDPAPIPGGFQMYGGQQRVFTYQVRTLAEGTTDLVAAIRSETDQGVVTTDSATASLEARVVREMELQNLSVSPTELADGEAFTVSADLVNIGNVDVSGVDVTAEVDPSVPGGAELGAPNPSTVPLLGEGQSVHLQIPGTLDDPRGATVRVSAAGTAADNGAPVSASQRVRAGQAPLTLSVDVDAPSTVPLATDGDGNPVPEVFEVTVQLTNTSSEELTGVGLDGLPRVEPAEGATEDPLEPWGPGPDLWIGTLQPEETRELTLEYRALRAGTADVVARAVWDGEDGQLAEEARSTVRVTTAEDLEVDVTKVPEEAELGEKVVARVEVTNLSTEHEVTDVQVEDLHFADVPGRVLSAPQGDAVGFTLQPGQTKALLWELTYDDQAGSGAGGASTVRFDVSGTRDGEEVSGTAERTIQVRTPAELRWEMERRFTGGGTAVTDYAGAHPDEWHIDITLDRPGGCDDGELELFTVAGDTETPFDEFTAVTGEPCRWRLALDNLSPFTLRARLTGPDDEILVEETERLEPRDIVIVSIGDSMSSGEGAMDPMTGWSFAQCDRSELAGPAQAALRIEDDDDPGTLDDDHTSVTFVHLACSGAWTESGLLGSFPGTGTQASLGPPLPPQLYTIPSILGTRKVDALLMTSGINDIKFENFLVHCLDHDDCADVPFEGEPVGDVIGQRLGRLPDMYASLSYRIGEMGIEADDVYLLEYPDPSKDDAGEYCDYRFATKHLEPAELEFLEFTMQVPLNQRGAEAAQAHGWNRVGGVMSAFRNHGVCAGFYWSNGIGDSLSSQGTVYGGFHPNIAGHAVFGDIIYRSMHGNGVDSGDAGNEGSITAPTQLSGDAPAGSHEIEISSNQFAAGDVVTINPGHANAQTLRVTEVHSLVFDQPLQADHFDGEVIVRTSSLPPETGANDPPDALDDELAVAPSGPTELDVLANDTDPEDQTLHVTSVTGDHVAASADGTALVWDRPGASCEPATARYRAVDEGGTTSGEATVTLTPECATLGIDVTGDTTAEGSTATLDATVDGAAGTSTVEWDLDDDGAFDDGAGASATIEALDGPASLPVAARVTDEAGRQATGSATVEVTNVAPTATLVAPPTGTTGTALTLSVTDVQDVAGDPVAIAFACGGGPFGASAVCTPSAAGAYAVAVRLDDGDGGITELGAAVTVTDPSPPSDTTDPVVTVSRPRPGEIWWGDRRVGTGSWRSPAVVLGWTTVTATATDDVGVTGVTFRVNDRTIPATAVRVTGSTYSFRYRPSSRAARDAVTVTALDEAGNTTTARTTILGFR